jgi:PIN domain nuclease of toxin-antitoxin system
MSVTRPILLDTCAAIWLANRSPLNGESMRELEAAKDAEGGIALSPISAWEIANLVSRGRLSLTLEPGAWFHALLASGIRLAGMPPEVLIASAFLPGTTLRDPADRIIAATARAFRYRLMTRDRPLLDFAAAGHLEAIAC